MNNSIKIVDPNTRNYAIGKLWLNGQSNILADIVLTEELTITQGLRLTVGKKSIVINRDLPKPMKLEAGTTLTFMELPWEKRENHRDPDYAIMVRVQREEANDLIAQEQAIRAERAEVKQPALV